MAPYDYYPGPKWDVKTIPDLTGKVAIVTGANSSTGIGWHTAHHLAIKGAKVYIGARNAQKAQDAIDEMMKETPILNGDLLQPFVVNLSDIKQIAVVAQKFLSSESRLDILVNNAALLSCPSNKDVHGISVSFATNHLAPFLLTRELMPLLKTTAQAHPGVRVVNVSSSAHEIPPAGVRFDSLESFNAELAGGNDDYNSKLARYGLSKLANILFTKELQNRFDAEGVPAVAITLHPGGVRTDGSTQLASENPVRLRGGGGGGGALSPCDGALTSLFAATNAAVWAEKDKYGGAYLLPFGAVQEANENATNPALAKELWETSERVLSDVLST